MAFCQSCGAEVEGRYCAKCGAASGQDTGSQTPPPPIPPSGSSASGLTDNVLCALCYIPIIGVIFLLIEPYNRNKLIRFHAFQGLFLLAVWWVASMVLSAILSMLGMFFFLPLIYLALMGLWLLVLYKTYTGEKIVLPVIGPIAEKQA